MTESFMNCVPCRFKCPKISEESVQSGLTGISLYFALIASANSLTIWDFPVPDIPARMTKGFERREI